MPVTVFMKFSQKYEKCTRVFIYDKKISLNILGKIALTGCVISAGNPCGGENNLPELDGSCAKGAGARQKIIFPHSVKTLTIFVFEIMPAVLKILKPVH